MKRSPEPMTTQVWAMLWTLEEVGTEAVLLLQELSRVLSSVDQTLQVEDVIGSPPMEDVRRLAAAALDALPS